MRHIATLTLIGHDKAGVIAHVTQLLFQLGANIEGLEEQVTRGHFSMTLQASWTTLPFDKETIRRQIAATAAHLKMDAKLHFAPQGGRHRLAVLVTRESHVLEGILAQSPARLGADPVVIIGNRPMLEPLARKKKIPFHVVPFEERAKGEAQILELLEKYQVDFIVLARFMKILSPTFVWRWKNKIINIHPSLLPAFPGANAYRQAYEKGVRVVGVTAHFVTPDLDEGPIIAQEALRVRPHEPLTSIVRRGQALETKCVLRAMRLFLTNRLDVHWGRVYQ